MLKAEREFIKLKSRIAIVLKELSVSLAAGGKKKRGIFMKGDNKLRCNC